MAFFKVPVHCKDFSLTHAELSIYIELCYLRNRFVGPRTEGSFYCTHRSLAHRSRTSTQTVFTSINKLAHHNLISFKRGPGNKTYFTILGLQTQNI